MPATEQVVQSFPKKAVLLSLDRHQFGVSRKADGDLVNTDADPEMFRLSKTIMKHELLDGVRAVFGETNAYVRQVCLPSMFKPGIYTVPVALMDRTEKFLVSQREKLAVAVGALCDPVAYERVKQTCRESLGNLYNEADYPTPDALRSQFWMSWRWMGFGVDESLRDINSDLYERERRNLERQIADIVEATDALLTARFQAVLDDMLERTQSGKVFRDSALTNVLDELRDFSVLNLGENSRLAELAERMRTLMQTVPVDVFRRDEGMKRAVLTATETIRKQLDAAAADRPKRVITFDEDAPAPVRVEGSRPAPAVTVGGEVDREAVATAVEAARESTNGKRTISFDLDGV